MLDCNVVTALMGHFENMGWMDRRSTFDAVMELAHYGRFVSGN